MIESGSCAHGSRFSDYLKAMVDVNNSVELKALYALSSLGLWMICMILRHEFEALDSLNNLGL